MGGYFTGGGILLVVFIDIGDGLSALGFLDLVAISVPESIPYRVRTMVQDRLQ
jgi:hypothetical protein